MPFASREAGGRGRPMKNDLPVAGNERCSHGAGSLDRAYVRIRAALSPLWRLERVMESILVGLLGLGISLVAACLMAPPGYRPDRRRLRLRGW
jgi:hypothetical protein